jgi:hypothetical protein
MWSTQTAPNNDPSSKQPGILQDGRSFTDYIQDSNRNERIKQENNIKTNEEYRLFLTKNADTLMQYNYDRSIHQNQTPYFPSVQHGSPFLYTSVQEDTKPYGYEDSTPKQMYLTREQIDDKKRRLYKEGY